MEKNEKEHRPWGFFSILSEMKDHKVKRITVYSKKRLSLQRHKHRAEHWFILKGNGNITLNDNKIKICEGNSIDIEKGAIHRIENTAMDDLIFIEIQSGDYFGEDDIDRIEDDFGRK